VRDNKYHVLKLLLKYLPDISADTQDNLLNADGLSPADLAFRKNNDEMLGELAFKGIVPQRPNADENTVIQYACSRGNHALLSLLLESRCPMIDEKSNLPHPLQIAVWKDDLVACHLLHPWCDESIGRLLVIQACRAGQHRIVGLLLSSAVPLVKYIWDPAWAACITKDFHQVGQTLLYQWSKDQSDAGYLEYLTAISIASFKTASHGAIKSMKLLLTDEWPALKYQDAQDLASSTLRVAVERGQVEIMEILVDAGTFKDGNIFGQIPLVFLAVSAKSVPAIRLLLNNGANATSRWNNCSLLEWSMRHGSVRTTSFLKHKFPFQTVTNTIPASRVRMTPPVRGQASGSTHERQISISPILEENTTTMRHMNLESPRPAEQITRLAIPSGSLTVQGAKTTSSALNTEHHRPRERKREEQQVQNRVSSKNKLKNRLSSLFRK
jgi:hypothetical protein